MDTQEISKLSYALGLSMGHNFRTSGIEAIDVAEFAEALESIYGDKQQKMTSLEAKEIINSFFTKMQEMQQAEAAAMGELNAKAGKEFLEVNGKREEVRTTATGLQYEVLEEGNGAQPKPGDSVTVHYTGKLIDGTVFDSSVDRGEPATFGVTQVIPGWVEALQLMKAGSKWRLFIPSDLAYGPQGAGGVIGPNQTLIFDVELISVEGK